jgi:hypothetical protein
VTKAAEVGQEVQEPGGEGRNSGDTSCPCRSGAGKGFLNSSRRHTVHGGCAVTVAPGGVCGHLC